MVIEILTTDLDWRLELQENGLRDEYFPRAMAKFSDLSLCKLHWLPGSGPTNLQESVYNSVNVEVCHWSLVLQSGLGS